MSTAFGIGCAGIMGDKGIFDSTRYLADVVALGITYGGKRKYFLGGQIGTASMFFVKTMEFFAKNQHSKVPLKNLFFIYSLVAVIILLLLWRLRVVLKKLNHFLEDSK